MYMKTANQARDDGELDLYRASKQENRTCKRAIEETIRQNFDGMYLAKKCEDVVLDKFGVDRVKAVLANTVRQKIYDGRFSQEVKNWARSFPLAEQDMYCVVETHPAVLEGFIRRIIRK